MIRKRAGWLLILFIGEMFTATAMIYFQIEIERAVVLALFIPLIISSGGNSGSQATTLIIRAMALGEVRLVDWWRVLSREILTGLSLGLCLAFVGFLRIMIWPNREVNYGPHYFWIALTVGASIIGVVLWGAIAGSMLPFILRRLNLDPAAASAPAVATIVDVTGLVIYFTVASVILHGILL
jgi:magnesium transporter